VRRRLPRLEPPTLLFPDRPGRSSDRLHRPARPRPPALALSAPPSGRRRDRDWHLRFRAQTHPVRVRL